MDFKRATDELFERVSHQELASALGVSVASIRQARLSPTAAAHRSPPPGWPEVVARIAEQRGERLLELAAKLRAKAQE